MNELELIKDLLSTDRFSGSKDWREGSVVERVEWLLSMYESSREDVLRMEVDIDDLKSGRYYPAP
jgi:hypothetical protein